MQSETIKDTPVLVYDGPVIATEAAGIDVIGETYGLGAELILLPAERLADDFFWLSTGLAGAILQKFQQYGFRVAVVGDFSRFVAESPSLRDFIYESNKRGQVMFLASRAELEARL